MQVVAVLRSTGYSPLGQMTQRGWIYTVAALDPNGDDGRLIIDAPRKDHAFHSRDGGG